LDLPLPDPGVSDDVLRRTLGLANELMLCDQLGLALARLSTIRSASRLASATISSRSLTIQRACLVSSGIVDRNWSSRS
jgi:hypothetical protein